MNRRSILQVLALTPLATIFPFLRTAEARSCMQCGEMGPGCAQFHDVKQPAPEGLHIYVSEGEDIVIAASRHDAVKVFKETTGPWNPPIPGPDDMPSLYADQWIQWDDHSPFEMSVDEFPEADFKLTEEDIHGGVVTKTQTYQGGVYTHSALALPRWWIARNGRGYLASRA